MYKHALKLYEDDKFLIKFASDYIESVLMAGDKAIAVATAPHLARISESLAARGLLDAKGRAVRGHYTALDADIALPLIMEDGMPDEARFRDTIGSAILDAAEAGGGRLFVFGEMGALLMAGAGHPLCPPFEREAALHFERLLNVLQTRLAFSLLCAYPLDAFPSARDVELFHGVCAEHSDVLPTESYDPASQGETLYRTIASLQQQASALRREVHDRELVEQALRELNVDRLTNLPNRNVFQDRLDVDIRKTQRSGMSLALLFIDLDHFKEINDTRGHETGDQLLKQVGQRLQGQVRESDTVARLGGDEFTITLGDLHELDSVTEIAEKICADLARPFLVGGELAYISASIGITVCPRDGATPGELLRNADQAMYRSKERGRNRYSYFTGSMQEVAQSRMALSNELRRAVEDGKLELHYQPIVTMTTGQIIKAEALVRWRHPERGNISPSEFIPIAEHTGLISSIGNWVFQQARRQATLWRSLQPQLAINVNVSPVQFLQENGEHCRRWLDDQAVEPYAVPPDPGLGLEITEGLLLAHNNAVLKQLLAFQQAGIKISLDDFGTGYSSLSYLRKFSLDYLKIDKSFVYNLEGDAANLALCEAIIVMAHKLGLRVIAEGVETAAQAEMLQRAGCDLGQGFLYGAAVTADAFEHLLGA